MSSGSRLQGRGGRVHRRGRWTFGIPHGVRACIVQKDDPSWAACETLEYEVFTDPKIGFYEPNDEGRITDFDSFGHQEFVAAILDGEVVGTLRLIYADEPVMREGLFQTFDHRSELGIYPESVERLEAIDPRNLVDFATMSVTRAARSSGAFEAIITRTLRRMWETNRRFGLACIDTPLYGKYKGRGLHFHDLGPSVPYWGSPTTAALLDSYSIPEGKDRLMIPLYRARGVLERAGVVRRP